MVVLGERHRPAVVPDVDDLRLAPHLPAAPAGQEHVVDVGPVGVEVLGHRRGGALAQLGERPDGVHAVARPAAPQRQRGAPVAVARDRPVHVALEPAAEAPVAHALGVPADARVQLHHAVAHGGRADVPGGLGVVEERGAAAPAVRVRVAVDLGAQQAPARLEVGHQVRIGVLHPAAGPGRDDLGEAAVRAHRVGGVQPVGPGRGHVVLAEGGGDVHDAGAVLDGHEGGLHHAVGSLQIGERGLVLAPEELVGIHGADDAGVLGPQHLRHQGLGQDQRLVRRARPPRSARSG